jgi:hypothetical protein
MSQVVTIFGRRCFGRSAVSVSLSSSESVLFNCFHFSFALPWKKSAVMTHMFLLA